VPVDSQGNTFVLTQFQYFSGFALTLNINGVDYNMAIQLSSSNTASIVLASAFNVTVSGTYTFKPTYNGNAIQCQNCSTIVKNGAIYPLNTKVYTENALVTGGLQIVNPTGQTNIDVTKNSPAFVL